MLLKLAKPTDLESMHERTHTHTNLYRYTNVYPDNFTHSQYYTSNQESAMYTHTNRYRNMNICIRPLRWRIRVNLACNPRKAKVTTLRGTSSNNPVLGSNGNQVFLQS